MINHQELGYRYRDQTENDAPRVVQDHCLVLIVEHVEADGVHKARWLVHAALHSPMVQDSLTSRHVARGRLVSTTGKTLLFLSMESKKSFNGFPFIDAKHIISLKVLQSP
jgi:hypothetical protein